MTAADRFKELLSLAHTELKPFGFRKRGQNFYLGRGDNVGVINFQKNKWSTRETISFTINVGAWSRRLENEFTAWMNTRELPPEASCQWRQRIGHWIPGSGGDRWWDITALSQPETVWRDICPTVLNHCLPVLRSRSTDEGLRDVWLADCVAGSAVPFDYLLHLLTELGPAKRIPEVRAAFAVYELERPARRDAVLREVRDGLSRMPPP